MSPNFASDLHPASPSAAATSHKRPFSPSSNAQPADAIVPFTLPPVVEGRFSKVTQAAAATRPATLLPFAQLGAKRNVLPWWKRSIDVAACLLAVPLLALCTFVMFLVTRRVSPGPVFYYQERIGYMGRRFRLFKFRTMKSDADCAIHHAHCTDLIRTNAPMVKLDHRSDARLIPFAWILRASGLDELPQIINVLRGEMSLVGPRPCTPAEFAHYRSWHRQRCDSLPGLSGLWQVSGKNRTTFEEMIGLDLRYTRNVSLWQDLRIIALTPFCLINQVRETRRARAKLPQPTPFQTACSQPESA